MLTLLREDTETQVRAAVDYRMVIDPVGAELAATRACEADVFLETYGNTTDQWAEEYERYDADSVFIGILDATGEAVGAARMIVPGTRTVKSLADMSRPPWEIDGTRSARAAGIDPARAWDVATLAVRRKQGRGGLISGALYHGLIQTLRANRAGWIVMIMDARARRLMHIAGLMTYGLPGTAPGHYLGSPNSTPVFSELTSMMDGQRRLNPEAHRLVDRGIGLDAMSVPSDFVVRRPKPDDRTSLRSI